MRGGLRVAVVFRLDFFFVLVVGWRRGVGGSVGVSRTAEGRQL